MPLKLADTSKVETFRDGSSWITLRTQITKEIQDTVNDLNSHYRLPAAAFGLADGPAEADAGVELRTNSRAINRTLFELLVVEWSLSDDKPTAADYDQLTSESGKWVDKCVTDALAKGRGRVEGNGRSPSRRKGSRTTSPAAPRSSSKPSPRSSDE
jgi:hypothetical protein